MITLQYEIDIHANAQKVWNVMWDTHTYSQWTHFFSPSSRMQSDWKIGGETLFQDASGNGMLATIVELEQFKHVIFQQQGILKNGVADRLSDEAQQCCGGLEKYFLNENDGVTHLYAEVETSEKYIDIMDHGFQLGFAVIKQLAEKT
ncbi:MAG: SRPBCC domain-containing protein [Acinetobacter sp.]